MLQNHRNSKQDVVKSSCSHYEYAVQRSDYDVSDAYEAGELVDVTGRDDLVARALVADEHNDETYKMLHHAKIDHVAELTVDFMRRKVMQECENTPVIRTSLLGLSKPPSEEGTPQGSISMTSHPISLALFTDDKDISQMRVFAGKPSSDQKVALLRHMGTEQGEISDDELGWKYERARLGNHKVRDIKNKRRRSIDLGSSDGVRSTDTYVLSRPKLFNESTSSTRGRSYSSPTICNTSPKSILSRRNLEGPSEWLLTAGKESPRSNRSVILGNVLIRDQIIEEPSANGWEILSAQQIQGCMCSKQTNNLRPPTMSITRGGRKTVKKTNMSKLSTFDIEQGKQRNFPPEDEIKITSKDPYAQRISDISEKLSQFLPAKTWPTPSNIRSKRKYNWDERSVTKSVSSLATSDNLSTADIFDITLVNEISKDNSYLKPPNKSESRRRRSSRLPWRDEEQFRTPFVSSGSRYNRPVTNYIKRFDDYNTLEINLVPKIVKHHKEKRRFSPISCILGPYV